MFCIIIIIIIIIIIDYYTQSIVVSHSSWFYESWQQAVVKGLTVLHNDTYNDAYFLTSKS